MAACGLGSASFVAACPPRRLARCVRTAIHASQTNSAVASPQTGRCGDRYILGPEEVKAFHRDGFVALHGVMSEEEMAQHIDPWYQAYLQRKIEVPGKDLCDMSGATDRSPEEFTVYNVMLPRKYNPGQQGNLFEKRSQDIAQQLQGGDMAIDYDQILAKRPGSEDSLFPWHQDMAYWPPLTSSLATATCWLAVTTSTVENGCMRFLKGSHKEPELRRHMPVSGSRENSHALYTAVGPSEEARASLQPLPRGSITVHNERVVHSSGPNRSKGWRNAYIIAYRKTACIEEERSLGFTHSHNDTHNWDVFNKWTSMDPPQ